MPIESLLSFLLINWSYVDKGCDTKQTTTNTKNLFLILPILNTFKQVGWQSTTF
jgi:hypothetical protein